MTMAGKTHSHWFDEILRRDYNWWRLGAGASHTRSTHVGDQEGTKCPKCIHVEKTIKRMSVVSSGICRIGVDTHPHILSLLFALEGSMLQKTCQMAAQRGRGGFVRFATRQGFDGWNRTGFDLQALATGGVVSSEPKERFSNFSRCSYLFCVGRKCSSRIEDERGEGSAKNVMIRAASACERLWPAPPVHAPAGLCSLCMRQLACAPCACASWPVLPFRLPGQRWCSFAGAHTSRERKRQRCLRYTYCIRQERWIDG